jgi:hypothetical protein
MKQPAHTVELEPWGNLNTGTRVVLEATTVILWTLKPDDRLTALITLLATQIYEIIENEDDIDAVIDVLRKQLKLNRPGSSSLQ